MTCTLKQGVSGRVWEHKVLALNPEIVGSHSSVDALKGRASTRAKMVTAVVALRVEHGSDIRVSG